MSRNYQQHQMRQDEAAREDDRAERAEMRARGIPTTGDPSEESSLACLSCGESFHPDSIEDSTWQQWCCPACGSWEDK